MNVSHVKHNVQSGNECNVQINILWQSLNYYIMCEELLTPEMPPIVFLF